MSLGIGKSRIIVVACWESFRPLSTVAGYRFFQLVSLVYQD